ncbi:IclR family transcriptional regulator [Saccharopolyspora sp. NPDC000995]
MAERPEKGVPARLDQRAAQRDGDIQAVTRCAEILRMVARDQAIRPTDVASGLGLQRSTAHRYLASMAGAGLVERRDDGTFVAGPLAVQLGSVAMRRSKVLDVAAPYMADLAAQAHETVVLSLWGGKGAVVTRVQEDAEKLVHVSVREGSELPPFAAQSQLFLAYLPDRDLVARLIADLPSHVRREVEERIEQVHRTGFGEHSMVVQGVRAVAAPVFDSRGVICATLAIVGASDAISAGPKSRLGQALADTAERISVQLGHSGATSQATQS